MPDAVTARMIDAVLPYVVGRRLVAHELDDEAAQRLGEWADPASDRKVIVVLGDKRPTTEPDVNDLLLWLRPSATEHAELKGWREVEVQHAFRVPYGLADDTAEPTLPPDENWPYAREGAGIWLDEAKPKETIGMLVFAEGTSGS